MKLTHGPAVSVAVKKPEQSVAYKPALKISCT